MLNLSPSSHDDSYTDSYPRSHRFLKQHPAISRLALLGSAGSRLANCDYNVDQVSTIVEPLLEPPSQCATPYFIQAAATGRTAFLITNLADDGEARVIATASTWLIGRSRNCAVTVLNQSISRCHAVIGHHPLQGFYVMDVGSSNGTFLNRQRLPALERRLLQHGDLIAFSHLQIEFFIMSAKTKADQVDSTTMGHS